MGMDSIPVTFKVSIEQELLDAIKAAMVVELDLDENTLEISLINVFFYNWNFLIKFIKHLSFKNYLFTPYNL